MNEHDLLLLTPDFPPNRGGVARYLSLFADYFHDRISVITSCKPIASLPYPCEYDSLLSAHIWPHWVRSIRLLIKRAQAYRCVVISHVIPFGTAALVAKWVTKKPYIIIVHGMDLRLALRAGKQRLLNSILKNAYLVLPNSEALAAELQQRFHLQNLLVIYPPLDPAFLQAPLNTPSDRFRLLTVSRLVERKGHERVLQALALLKMNGSLLTFDYTIVGDGPMRGSLEAMVEELDLTGHVQFAGEVSDEDLPKQYAASDVFVMPVKDDPIDKEGFGMVYLEAAACGVPSIATQMSGVNEAVIDGQTGILVPDGDIESLAAALLKLANDVSLREQLGTAARHRAQSQFTSQTQFSKLEPYLV